MTESSIQPGKVRALEKLPRRRHWINALTGYVVGLGGAAVIAAIALIFFYLVWVAVPLFQSAQITPGSSYALPLQHPLILDANETSEIGMGVDADAELTFFDLSNGDDISDHRVGDRPLLEVARVYPSHTLYAAQDVDHRLLFFKTTYAVSFKDDERLLTPQVELPFEGSPLELEPFRAFEVYQAEDTLTVATLTPDKTLHIHYFGDADPDYALEFPEEGQIELDHEYSRVVFGPRGQWIYLIDDMGSLALIDISVPDAPSLELTTRISPEHTPITALAPLLGRYSLMVATADARLTQWTLVRGEFGYRMNEVRNFSFEYPIVAISTEQQRKGLVALDQQNTLHLLYTTSHRKLADFALGPEAVEMFQLTPRGDHLLLANQNAQLDVLKIRNEHPEVSWKTLWGKVVYEGYSEPIYSWQSSSAGNDFEPKFSLTPLAFGTMKAALYAMLLAIPLAIMGAIYTAFFMNPTMRRWVKPGIEIMAALPTVILGFLAGLWLAPIIEKNLTAMLSLVVFLPTGMLLFALTWHRLPDSFTRRFEGWYGAVSVPLLLVFGALSFALAGSIEAGLFDGNLKAWLRENMGLAYDQRNSLVVGIAMGLSVIPTIFSISEDAIYGVPRHLVNGSLALGATTWQTLIRVVLLTASPGIFSAIMIGMGRAVGETMIVLMATGNTPIMDMNIFEGMRTFSANIAVELPEAEVASTHYRILFLTALVLFLITFVFNTAAELVRNRLRSRYGSL